MQLLEQFHSELGLNLRPEWMNLCLGTLQTNIPQFQQLHQDQKFKHVLQIFLHQDLEEISLGGNLPDIKNLHKQQLKGRFILQLNEVVNIGASSKERYLEKGPTARSLRLSMTDGKQHVMAFEDRPMPELKVNMPVGVKVQLFDVEVRRGILLLGPENLRILGGQVEVLEARRQRVLAKWSEPVRAQRTGRTAVDFQNTLRQAAWTADAAAAAAGPSADATQPHPTPQTLARQPSFAPANTQHHMSPDPLSAASPLSHPATQPQSTTRPGTAASQAQQQLPSSFQPGSIPPRHPNHTPGAGPSGQNTHQTSDTTGARHPTFAGLGGGNAHNDSSSNVNHGSADRSRPPHTAGNSSLQQPLQSRPWQAGQPQQSQQQRTAWQPPAGQGSAAHNGVIDLSLENRQRQSSHHESRGEQGVTSQAGGHTGNVGSRSSPHAVNNERAMNWETSAWAQNTDNPVRAAHLSPAHNPGNLGDNPSPAPNRANAGGDTSAGHNRANPGVSTSYEHTTNTPRLGQQASEPFESLSKKPKTSAVATSLQPQSSTRLGVARTPPMQMEVDVVRQQREASRQLPPVSPPNTHTPHATGSGHTRGGDVAQLWSAIPHTRMNTPQISLSQHGSQLPPSRGLSKLSLSRRQGAGADLSQQPATTPTFSTPGQLTATTKPSSTPAQNTATTPPADAPVQSTSALHTFNARSNVVCPPGNNNDTPSTHSSPAGRSTAPEVAQDGREGVTGSRLASSNATDTCMSPTSIPAPITDPRSPRSHSSPDYPFTAPASGQHNDNDDTDDDVVIIHDDDDDDDDDYHQSQPMVRHALLRHTHPVAVKMDVDDDMDQHQQRTLPPNEHTREQHLQPAQQQQQQSTPAVMIPSSLAPAADRPAINRQPPIDDTVHTQQISPTLQQPAQLSAQPFHHPPVPFGSCVEAFNEEPNHAPAATPPPQTSAAINSPHHSALNDDDPPTLMSLTVFEQQLVPTASPDNLARAQVIAVVDDVVDVSYGDDPDAPDLGPGCIVSIVDGGVECPAILAPCVIEAITGCSWQAWTAIHRAELDEDECAAAAAGDAAQDQIEEVERYLYKFYGTMWIQSGGPGTPIQIVRLQPMERESVEATIRRQWVLQQSDSSCGAGLGWEE